MGKVLVTGASGFIGWHLVKALCARGDEVTCLVRKTSRVERLQPLGVRLAYGDVTDPETLPAAVAGASTVYHLAGLLRALSAEQLNRVNGQGVANVARACADQTSPPVLVVVSSLAAAGPSPRGRLRTESDLPEPISNYGRSKRAGEEAAEEFAGRVPISVVRPAIVFGEADKDCLKMFRSVSRLGLHVVPGYRAHRFSLIHAADLAELTILAARHGRRLAAPSETSEENAPAGDEGCEARGYYFGAAEEHPTYYQLGRIIGKALGRRRTLVLPVGLLLVWAVAGVAELIGQIRKRPPVLGIDKVREASAGSWACSGERAADELGFAVAAPLADRMHQTAQWYRQQGWI